MEYTTTSGPTRADPNNSNAPRAGSPQVTRPNSNSEPYRQPRTWDNPPRQEQPWRGRSAERGDQPQSPRARTPPSASQAQPTNFGSTKGGKGQYPQGKRGKGEGKEGSTYDNSGRGKGKGKGKGDRRSYDATTCGICRNAGRDPNHPYFTCPHYFQWRAEREGIRLPSTPPMTIQQAQATSSSSSKGGQAASSSNFSH